MVRQSRESVNLVELLHLGDFYFYLFFASKKSEVIRIFARFLFCSRVFTNSEVIGHTGRSVA